MFMFITIYLSFYVSIYLSLSFSLSIYLPTYLSIYLSIHANGIMATAHFTYPMYKDIFKLQPNGSIK